MCKKVDIIVVNWNSGASTLNAIRPYLHYNSSSISCNIIVVDNASIDNSQIILRNKVNKLIINDKNLGFGGACNQAFKGSTADYILLLNPDTLSEPVVLEKLIQFLENNLDYGITGPRQVDAHGNILRTCGRFPTVRTSLFEIFGLSKLFPKTFTPAPIMVDWDHIESRDVDQVMGSYMVIRKCLLDKTGFMDDDYFVYGEDRDLSKRFKNAGHKTFYNSEYSIFHESGGTGEPVKAMRLFYSLSSRRRYWNKHLGKLNCFVLTIMSIMIEPFLRMTDSLLKERNLHLKIIAKAYLMYIREMLNF